MIVKENLKNFQIIFKNYTKDLENISLELLNSEDINLKKRTEKIVRNEIQNLEIFFIIVNKKRMSKNRTNCQTERVEVFNPLNMNWSSTSSD